VERDRVAQAIRGRVVRKCVREYLRAILNGGSPKSFTDADWGGRCGDPRAGKVTVTVDFCGSNENIRKRSNREIGGWMWRRWTFPCGFLPRGPGEKESEQREMKKGRGRGAKMSKE